MINLSEVALFFWEYDKKMPNPITPLNQVIHINSKETKIFDFNTPSSHVYLGETINKLLRPFGNNVVLTGLKITNLNLNTDNVLSLTITSGECIVDNTLVQYTQDVNLELDTTMFDDTGLIIPSISFNFIPTQQKNLSSINLNYYDTKTQQIKNIPWYTENNHIVLGLIEFNKETKVVHKRLIPYFNRPKIVIQNKEYTVYPTDLISNRMLEYLYEYQFTK